MPATLVGPVWSYMTPHRIGSLPCPCRHALGSLHSAHAVTRTIQATMVNLHILLCIVTPSLLKLSRGRPALRLPYPCTGGDQSTRAHRSAQHPPEPPAPVPYSMAHLSINDWECRVSIAKGPDPEVVLNIAPQFVQAIWLHNEEDNDQPPE